MKVGTLTFHNANNYGAVLQAYALQNYITKLGHDTEIIAYSPNKQIISPRDTLASKIFKYLKHPKEQLMARKISTDTSEKFQSFRKDNFMLSEKLYLGDNSIEIDPPCYDYYIAGSDQIWNTDLSNKSKAFYLHFVKDGKKISYAASFGKKDFNEYEEKYIINYLSSFDYISVREKYHANLLSRKYNIDAKVTLDPVFLLDKVEWEKVQKPIGNLPKKYVLVYVLEYSDDLFECAKKKSIESNCELIYISMIKEKINGKVLSGIGPSEFLYAFVNASYVCTNSFHGTAFSIIFNKNFSVVKHSTRNSRIDNILEITDLKNRYYKANDSNVLKDINYKFVNNSLDSVILDSQNFLKNSLSIVYTGECTL